MRHVLSEAYKARKNNKKGGYEGVSHTTKRQRSLILESRHRLATKWMSACFADFSFGAGPGSLAWAARMLCHVFEPRPWEAPSLEGGGHWLDTASCIVKSRQLQRSSSQGSRQGHSRLDLQGLEGLGTSSTSSMPGGMMEHSSSVLKWLRQTKEKQPSFMKRGGRRARGLGGGAWHNPGDLPGYRRSMRRASRISFRRLVLYMSGRSSKSRTSFAKEVVAAGLIREAQTQAKQQLSSCRFCCALLCCCAAMCEQCANDESGRSARI